jgi:ribosomal protein L29
MTEIEDLEDKLESLKARLAAGTADKQAAEIERLGAELNEKRRELARISDGCGRPHHR